MLWYGLCGLFVRSVYRLLVFLVVGMSVRLFGLFRVIR